MRHTWTDQKRSFRIVAHVGGEDREFEQARHIHCFSGKSFMAGEPAPGRAVRLSGLSDGSLGPLPHTYKVRRRLVVHAEYLLVGHKGTISLCYNRRE